MRVAMLCGMAALLLVWPAEAAGDDVVNVVTGPGKSQTVSKGSVEIKGGDVYVDGVKQEKGYAGGNIAVTNGAVSLDEPDDPGKAAAKEKAKLERQKEKEALKESIKREAATAVPGPPPKVTNIGGGTSSVGEVKVAPGSQTGKITVGGKVVDPGTAKSKE